MKGINYFGVNRWELISRYFLPHRSGNFLSEEFNQSEKLKKKRIKHNIPFSEIDYKKELNEILD